MFYKDDITNNANGLSVPMLTEAVETIAACSNDMMVAAEDITALCNLVENMEEVYKDLLITRVEVLKRLASLYKSRSMRFKAVAQKLAEGAAGDEALPANAYC